jgi:ubiquinone/menaquinone biosynthesis C-methylase UbiE
MSSDVEEHYSAEGIVGRIEAGLRELGKDLGALTLEDLAPVDQFHIRGHGASVDMAARMGLVADYHVLDIGSGTGGPARLLARTFGCQVTGIDLTASYCEIAATLAEWVGLSDSVRYQQGDALDLPFEDDTFDAAITQHVAMNIAAKDRMYAQAHRVLKPGAAFAVYDVMQGPAGDLHFPVPWAADPSISFLATPDETRDMLRDAGFEIVSETDSSAESLDWFVEMTERLKTSGKPPLGFHILLGEQSSTMQQNQVLNLREGRICTVEFICRAQD